MSFSALPKIGMGTFRLKGNDARDAVKSALSLGYRHIDTAQMYGNEGKGTLHGVSCIVALQAECTHTDVRKCAECHSVLLRERCDLYVVPTRWFFKWRVVIIPAFGTRKRNHG